MSVSSDSLSEILDGVVPENGRVENGMTKAFQYRDWKIEATIVSADHLPK